MLDPGDDSSSSGSSWRGSKAASSLRSAGSSLSQSGQSQLEAVRAQAARGAVPSYKKGGRVKKTGLARVHKGEYVVPRNKVRKVKRAMRGSGRR